MADPVTLGIGVGANLLGGILGGIGASKKRRIQQQVELKPDDLKRLITRFKRAEAPVEGIQADLGRLREVFLPQIEQQAPVNLLAPTIDPLTALALSRGEQQIGQRATAARNQIQRTLGRTQPGVARALAAQAALQQAGQVNQLLLPALQQQVQNRLLQAQAQRQQEAGQRATAALLSNLLGQRLAVAQQPFQMAQQIAALRAGRTTTQPGTPFLQTFGQSLGGLGSGLLIANLLGGKS